MISQLCGFVHDIYLIGFSIHSFTLAALLPPGCPPCSWLNSHQHRCFLYQTPHSSVVGNLVTVRLKPAALAVAPETTSTQASHFWTEEKAADTFFRREKLLLKSAMQPHYPQHTLRVLQLLCCRSFLRCGFWSLPFLSVHFLHPKGILFIRDSLSAQPFRSPSLSKRKKGEKAFFLLLFILSLIYFSKDNLSRGENIFKPCVYTHCL